MKLQLDKDIIINVLYGSLFFKIKKVIICFLCGTNQRWLPGTEHCLLWASWSKFEDLSFSFWARNLCSVFFERLSLTIWAPLKKYIDLFMYQHYLFCLNLTVGCCDWLHDLTFIWLSSNIEVIIRLLINYIIFLERYSTGPETYDT